MNASRLVSTTDIVDPTDLALLVSIKKRAGTLVLSGIFEEFIYSKTG